MRQTGLFLLKMTLLAVSFVSCSKSMSNFEMVPVEGDIYANSINGQTKTDFSSNLYFLDEEKIAAFVNTMRPGVVVDNMYAIYDEDTPLIYVYNYEKGCEVFSSDKRMQPSLAFADNGSLSEGDFGVEPLSLWLEMIKEEVHSLRNAEEYVNENTEFWRSFLGKNVIYLMKDSLSDSLETKSIIVPEHTLWVKEATGMRLLTDTTTLVRVPKLTYTSWGRSEPWNLFAPLDSTMSHRFINSSAAVAASQLLYFHHSVSGAPSFFQDLSYSMIYDYLGLGEHFGVIIDRCSRSNASSKWNNMAITASTTDSSSVRNVSELIVHSDAAMSTKYSYTSNQYSLLAVHPSHSAAAVFNEYSLHNSTMAYSRDTVISNLCLGMPVYGNKSDTAWLFDAFRSMEYTYLVEYQWLRQPDPDGQLWPYETEIDTGSPGEEHYNGELTYEQESVISRYFQLNWGLNGNRNDLYVTINTSGSWNSGEGYTSSGATIIYNVHPYI